MYPLIGHDQAGLFDYSTKMIEIPNFGRTDIYIVSYLLCRPFIAQHLKWTSLIGEGRTVVYNCLQPLNLHSYE